MANIGVKYRNLGQRTVKDRGKGVQSGPRDSTGMKRQGH
jgi:hypothetical protein